MNLCTLLLVLIQIATLRHLGKHQNILSLHDVLFLKNETIMFTDLVQGGELFDYIVDMVSGWCRFCFPSFRFLGV